MGMTDPENADRSSSRSSSGPSKSSPAGGSQAASGYGDGSRSNSTSSRSSGPSKSSPAGGSQAASGYGDGSRSSDRTYSSGPTDRGPGTTSSRDGSRSSDSRASPGFGGSGSSQRSAERTSMDAYRSSDGGRSTATGFASLTGGSFRGAQEVGMRPSARGAQDSSMGVYERAKGDWFDKVLGQIIGQESAGDPKAKNPLSSATGLAQFTSGTWLGMIDKYRPDLVTGRTRQELLDLRFDPAISMEMATQFTKDNIARLEAAGLPVTAANVYAMHFLGEGGGPAALKADPSTSAVDVLGAGAVKANPGIMSGKTIGQVLGTISKKMSGVPSTVADMLSGERYADETTAIPVSRPSFVDKYLSPRDPIQEARADQGMMRAAAGQPAAQPVPGRQMRSPRSMEGGLGGISLDDVGDVPERRTPTNVPVSTPSATPTAPATPAAPAASVPAVEAEQAKRTGGLGGQIVAGGIDLLVGAVPGVGIANALAGIFTEGGSIGTRIVDDFLSGESQSISDEATFKSGDGSANSGDRSRDPDGEGEDTTASQVKADAQRFEDRYLTGNYWRPNLPTPRQKWGSGLLG